MKIVIEGNIGCGKSSLISEIGKNLRIPTFLEPINNWTLINKYYNDIPRWGFTFNLEVLLSLHKWKQNNFDAIYERSPNSCRHVFFQMLADTGDIIPEEHFIFDNIYKEMAWKSDATIYIKTDPHVCMDRMTKRGRNCENNVTLDYLKKIHEKHEIMINKLDNCYTVDGNRSYHEVYDDVSQILKKLNVNKGV